MSIHSVLDEPGSNFDDGDNRGNRRAVRKERDDKVHDSIIEERIQRERPCRTLFIRNIKASLSLKMSGPLTFFNIFSCINLLMTLPV